MKRLYLIFGIGTLLVFFQNCNSVNFQTSPSTSGQEQTRGTNDGEAPPDSSDRGLAGGHFDLDTASQVYSFGNGHTDKHEHEYDDKYDVNFVDFLNMASGFTRIRDRVSSTQRFYIIVANAQLSPGGVLEINGTDYPVTSYQQKVSNFRNLLPTYSLSELASFKIHFDRNAITQGGLVGTITSCVRSNQAGANGEYRDGALTVQILEANTAAINPATGTAAAQGGFLWEATIFWHHDGDCY
jgi:hypothetical protein